jgi:transcriptional regulator with XRE-family HTH domain
MSKNMDDAKKIGLNLKAMRLEYGYSQKQIAHILSVSFQQVQKYEKGTNRLPVEKLFRLQKFYGVPYHNFFEGLHDKDMRAAIDPIDVILRRVTSMEDQVLKRKIYDVNLVLLGEAVITPVS